MQIIGSLVRHLLRPVRQIVDFRHGRLAPRLMALFLIAAIVPLGAAVAIGGRAATGVLQDQAQANLQSYAASVAGQLEAALSDHLKDAKGLAADPAVVGYLLLPADQRNRFGGRGRR